MTFRPNSWRMSLTFSTPQVNILPDDDLSLMNVLSYAIIKKWFSVCVDPRSYNFCDLTCLRMHLPMISQWQKYRLPLKRTWPAQILQSYSESEFDLAHSPSPPLPLTHDRCWKLWPGGISKTFAYHTPAWLVLMVFTSVWFAIFSETFRMFRKSSTIIFSLY